MPHPRLTAALVLLTAAAGAAQPPAGPDPAALRGDSTATRKRLADLERKLAAQPADAADDLQRVLDDPADELISVDGRHAASARRVAQGLLARLPADALDTYRDRVQEPARKLLDAGKRDRDPRPLWELVDRFFVSRPAEEGLLLLGDLLFERGEFRAAEAVWRRLLPDADAPYPRPAGDPAAVRARVVLAAVFQGEPERDRAAAELTVFKKQHPTAGGKFAGGDGPFADTLQKWFDTPPRFAQPPGSAAWATFGGGPARDGRAGGRVPTFWPSRPTWTARVPPPAKGPGLPVPGDQFPPRVPPFGHPVVAGGRVFVANANGVWSFDLVTGHPAVVLPPPPADLFPRRPLANGRPAPPDPPATLTAAGDRVYARTGRQADSALVCLAAADPGKPPAVVWKLPPPPADGMRPAGAWEGAPLVAGNRLWATVARVEGGRVTHAIVCYDPADADQAPARPAWVTEVSDSPLPADGDARTRRDLLTLAGRHVVFCSHGGAVVAVDAASGRRAWGFRYPRAARRPGLPPSPEPSPCVAHGGRVFVAPADADRVFALDAETGTPLWESGPVEGAQIQGVSRGRLVLAAAGPLRSVRGLNVANGSYRPEDGGWIQAVPGTPPSYGRGLVTDDAVVWPSAAGLFVLDPADGLPRSYLRGRLTEQPGPGGFESAYFGNLAFADGCLVGVSAHDVFAYVPEATLYGGKPGPAGASFRRRFDAAEDLLAAGRVADASSRLRSLAIDDGESPARRARAAARWKQVDPAADTPAELRDEWLVGPDGVPATLGELEAGRAAAPVGNVPPRPAPEPTPHPPRIGRGMAEGRSLTLPPGSVPLKPIPGGAAARLVTAAGGDLWAVSTADGTHTEHTTADPFGYAADYDAGFVAAGPRAVAVYGRAARPEWVFRVPDADPGPPPLSAFALAGPRLVARLGDFHLIALDLAARRVAWVLASDGRPRLTPAPFPFGPRFGPHLLAAGRVVVAQSSDGTRWAVAADTGKVLHAAGTSRTPWAGPPADLGGGFVAVADGPGAVTATDPATGRVLWTFDAGGDPSLTGRPPQLLARGDSLFVAVSRNHGVEVERLDPATGRRRWAGGPAFVDADRLDLSAADADPTRLYLIAGGRLGALALSDGRPAWSAPLPAGAWEVRAGTRAAVVLPREAVSPDPPAAVLRRAAGSLARTPAGWRLPGLAAAVYHAWVGRAAPVLAFDPDDGRPVARVDLPAAGPAVAARLDGDTAAVATGAQVSWLR